VIKIFPNQVIKEVTIDIDHKSKLQLFPKHKKQTHKYHANHR